MSQSTEDNRTFLVELVKRAQKDNSHAFEEIVTRTEKMLRKLCYPIVGEALLEDALQETYLLVFRQIGQLKEAEAFLAWLSRIALHTCYRLKAKHPATAELSREPRAKDENSRALSRISLQQALNRLSRRDRDILILREIIQLSYEELARALNVPEGTVKSRLNKARKALKERLEL